MKLHPMIKSQLAMLAAQADHEAVKLGMRRDAIKSLQPQSGAARIRLTEEQFQQHVLAAGYRWLLSVIEREEATS